ncbi:MAG: YetF domain-containing protein [Bacillota bacterium]
MIYLDLALKLTLGLAVLFAITKILGKTQISQITPFDFISSIVLGELLVHAVYERSVIFIVYSLTLWGFLIYGLEILGQKVLKLRAFFEGNPSIVIRNGKIDRRQMKINKLNINQLLNLLRQKDIFSVTDVKYAILEPNGSLSVLRNFKDNAPTREDFKMPAGEAYLPVALISDGQILWENLKDAGLDRSWLFEQLNSQGIKRPEEVYYAEWRQDKGLSVTLIKQV